MKLVIAIIQPHKLEAVKRELEAVEVNLMTVTNVLGQGRQKGVTEIYRGAREAGGLLNKVRLDIAVNEDFVEPTIDAVTRGAHTGSVGDGKIFVVELAQCIRISTGERGVYALAGGLSYVRHIDSLNPANNWAWRLGVSVGDVPEDFINLL